MQRTISARISPEETHAKKAIKEYDAAMVRVLKRIKKDQQAIQKLKKETRTLLDAIKAA